MGGDSPEASPEAKLSDVWCVRHPDRAGCHEVLSHRLCYHGHHGQGLVDGVLPLPCLHTEQVKSE